MSQREDLAEAIREYMNGFNMLPPSGSIAKMVLNHLHPTVSTVEEVAALPFGSVVLDDDDDAWQRFGSSVWWCTDRAIEEAYTDAELVRIYGPLTVLRRGGEA